MELPAVRQRRSSWGSIDTAGASVRSEIDALGRDRDRADREADAARRLDELKRKMGK